MQLVAGILACAVLHHNNVAKLMSRYSGKKATGSKLRLVHAKYIMCILNKG